jgi:hypothetical protein
VNHSSPIGFGTIWEAVIDIDGGRPSGISNLLIEFQFPSHITKIERLSDGGCEGLKILTDPLTDPKGLKFKRITERSGRIFASKCPDGAKLIFRFEVAETALDDKPRNDEGSFSGKFDWALPIVGTLVPWSLFDFSSILEGVIPASKPTTPMISTSKYPASVSKQPYYDLTKRRGRIVSILNPRDFNDRLKMDSTLCFFSRPSTKVRLYSKKGDIIGAYVYWIHCDRPLVIERLMSPINDKEMNKLEANNIKAGIQLLWRDCNANLSFLPVRTK